MRLCARSLAAALMAERRWSSSSILFCLQYFAISLFVTLSSSAALSLGNHWNLGSGGGGGGGGDLGVGIDLLVFASRPSFSSILCFILINLTLILLANRLLSCHIYEKEKVININCIEKNEFNLPTKLEELTIQFQPTFPAVPMDIGFNCRWNLPVSHNSRFINEA